MLFQLKRLLKINHKLQLCWLTTVEAAYYDHFGTRVFGKYNRLITLSGGYKICIIYLNSLLQHFTCIKNNKIYLKKLVLPVICLDLVVPE